MASKHDAVRDWLLTCPSLTKLGFLFGKAEIGGAIIIPSDTQLAAYVDGSELRRYAFELAIYLPASYRFGEGNVAQQEIADGVADWVAAQDAAGNLPAFPAGCRAIEARVLESDAPYIAAQDENLAKYVIPFAIDYYKEV